MNEVEEINCTFFSGVTYVTMSPQVIKDVRMTQITVGLRELKAQLSHYIRQVKSGTTLIITERGKPVGRIMAVNPSLDERVQELIGAGIIAWNGQKLTTIAPVAEVQGEKTIADLLLENRE
jgi:prevent-host-death family protein